MINDTLLENNPNSSSGYNVHVWLLDASLMELIAPDGKHIPLSHNEFRVLQTASIKAVREDIRGGADWIKFAATGGSRHLPTIRAKLLTRKTK
jgi:hypothetical protein